jgi:hypothetical protein
MAIIEINRAPGMSVCPLALNILGVASMPTYPRQEALMSMHEVLQRGEKMILSNPDRSHLLVAACTPGTRIERAPRAVRRKWAESGWVYGSLRQTKSLKREVGRPYWNSLEEFHQDLDHYLAAGWEVLTVKR